MANNRYGHKNNMKWVLIENAPYTASGLNEIKAGAETKTVLMKLSRLLGIKPTPAGRYQIHKVEEPNSKKEQ